MKKLSIFKIGGQLIETPELLAQSLDVFAAVDGPKLLVHGGGRRASLLCNQLGIPVHMTNGRRLTDAATLEIAVMVYAGLTNKTIVAQLQARACDALGLSGADLNSIKAELRPVGEIDYGLAGDITQVNTIRLNQLLKMSICPVVCPITHDRQGQLLNTNADTIAASLAASLASDWSVDLYFCFEQTGVLLDLNKPESLIKRLDQKTAKKYQQENIISAGMIPKLDNGFRALAAGVSAVWIGQAEKLMQQTGTRLV